MEINLIISKNQSVSTTEPFLSMWHWCASVPNVFYTQLCQSIKSKCKLKSWLKCILETLSMPSPDHSPVSIYDSILKTPDTKLQMLCVQSVKHKTAQEKKKYMKGSFMKHRCQSESISEAKYELQSLWLGQLCESWVAAGSWDAPSGTAGQKHGRRQLGVTELGKASSNLLFDRTLRLTNRTSRGVQGGACYEFQF